MGRRLKNIGKGRFAEIHKKIKKFKWKKEAQKEMMEQELDLIEEGEEEVEEEEE